MPLRLDAAGGGHDSYRQMDVPWPAIVLIAVLALASAGAWCWLWTRRRVLTRLARVHGGLPQVSPWAAALTALWLVNRLVIAAEDWLHGEAEVPFDPETVLDALRLNFLLQLGMLGIFWMAALAGVPDGPQALGLAGRGLRRPWHGALVTVTAAWLPVFGTLLLTYKLRSAERQHAVLRMLQEQPSWEAYSWAILSAVVMAPLVEELLFRVILQSWLTARLGRTSGWIIASVLFALVHGFPDSIAILPLALVLGAAWLIGRRYWTIVIAHALFNAVMLILDALLPEG